MVPGSPAFLAGTCATYSSGEGAAGEGGRLQPPERLQESSNWPPPPPIWLISHCDNDDQAEKLQGGRRNG